METYATVVYVIVDEVLKILNAKDEPNSKMSDAEVMTFAIMTARIWTLQILSSSGLD